MPITAAQVKQKWLNRSTAAGQDWVDGIQNLTENPAEKAIAKADYWQQRVSSEDAKSKFKSSLGAVKLSDIKAKVAKLGASRYTSGITASADKFEKRIAPVLEHIAAGKSEFDRRVILTIDDSAQKAADWVRYMATYKRAS